MRMIDAGKRLQLSALVGRIGLNRMLMMRMLMVVVLAALDPNPQDDDDGDAGHDDDGGETGHDAQMKSVQHQIGAL